MQPDSSSHAPRGRANPLFLLAIISLLLGALFLVVRLMFDTDTPELLTEAQQRRNLVLLVMGALLSVMGVLTLLFHIASDPNLAEGVEGRLAERLQNGNLLVRAALLPVLLVSQKRGRLILNIGLMIVLAGWLFGLTNYLFQRHDLWRIDLTSTDLYTLSSESRELVKSLDTGERQIRIVGLMPPRLPETAQVQSLVEQYKSISDKVKAEYLDPTAISREDRALKLQELDIAGTDAIDAGGVVVQSGHVTETGWKREKSKWLPRRDLWRQDTNKGYPNAKRTFIGELKISSAILEVLDEKRPKIYFLAGHQERSIGDFSPRGLGPLVQRLRERNYEIGSLNLLAAKQPGVPDDCSLLVVAGPQVSPTAGEVAEIKAYLERGGDALFLLGPTVSPRPDRSSEWRGSLLADMLSDTYGVGLGDRLVARLIPTQRGQKPVSDLVLITLDRNHDATRPLVAANRPVRFLRARPVQKVATVNVNTTALVKTDPNWGRTCYGVAQLYRRSQDLEPGPFTLAVAVNNQDKPVEGKPLRRTRFVVFGGVEWATKQALIDRSAANLELFLNSVNWCIERETRSVGQVRTPPDYRLNMSEEELRTFKLASIFGFPLFAVALGIFAWVLRYRS